ncbi:GNAT family N-acetyltransferase [Streptomyces atratus]|uniref:GNAT family N-acetyltransferase n=1 Tax=Streptomyces atratus TaxID=1893 RepID=A0A2Z5JE99_STRAR|nr:GNAT family N-acetyltransferase [Streptomyces atratus]AXE78563.1 GNAT family N-acetyltransferase [Streptomyces atratus]
MERTASSSVRIEPWSEADLELLRRANAPELMDHLGGPETEEQLIARHERYVAMSADRTGGGRMFRITLADGGDAVGTIGFWERSWQGREVYETGWAVLPGYQGLGIATVATTAVAEQARAEHKHRYLHAYPSVGNGASNAVCRKAGFTLIGTCDFEYPPGNVLLTNDWRLDLTPDAPDTGR